MTSLIPEFEIYTVEVISDFKDLEPSISSLMTSYTIPGIQLAIVKNERYNER